MLSVEGTVVDSQPDFGPPILRLGFRIFFLAAGLFAIFSMALWMATIVFSVNLQFTAMSSTIWHAHEMIFGYTLAVVAGFLLTAIKNWTGDEVLRGKALAVLFSLWLLARIMLLMGDSISIQLIAIIDTAFLLMLAIVCLRPVLQVKQYKQVGIISKLFLLLLCNVTFYLGVTGVLAEGSP